MRHIAVWIMYAAINYLTVLKPLRVRMVKEGGRWAGAENFSDHVISQFT